MSYIIEKILKEYPCPYTGELNQVINHISHQSKQVKENGLYVALAGRNSHGVFFLREVWQQGCRVIALPLNQGKSDPSSQILGDHRYSVEFQNSEIEFEWAGCILWLSTPRTQLAELSELIYGKPAHALTMIGITGTNGKTTTSSLLADLIEAEFQGCGLFGTVFNRMGKNQQKANLTTPEAPQLHEMLKDLRDQKIQHCVMEVSSIGIEEQRVSAIPFSYAIFSNLSEDHLDYHHSMENYAQAKAKLFGQRLKADGLALINMDDPYGAFMYDRSKPTAKIWQLRMSADPKVPIDQQVYWENLKISDTGMSGLLCSPKGKIELQSKLIGVFNAYNLASAVAIAMDLEIATDTIQSVVERFEMIGRMQKIQSSLTEIKTLAYPKIFVDYAHTPDALSNVIRTLRKLVLGRLIVIFGCGGDRDQTKRALMGKVSTLADLVIISNDNPRSEVPEQIAQDILIGVQQGGFQEVKAYCAQTLHFDLLKENQKVAICLDRQVAIRDVILGANANDMILIAGKGHESYQEIKGIRYDFDDAQVAKSAIDQRQVLNTIHLESATHGELVLGEHRVFQGISIDTRTLQKDQAFFCLKEQRDAHDFIPQALQAGANTLIVQEAWFHENKETLKTLYAQHDFSVIAVDHPQVALQRYANAHRKQEFSGILIALTGSNGKTTTKEMLFHCLSQYAPTLATQGNLNNHLGVPLTLLRLAKHHQYAVIEMGMNAPKEIEFLADLAKPQIGLITTIGTAHLEGLKTIENIARAKGELFKSLSIDAHAFYHEDLPYVEIATEDLIANRHCLKKTDWSILDLKLSPTSTQTRLKTPQGEFSLILPLSGKHHVQNAILVLAIVHHLKLDLSIAIDALQTMPIPHLRGEVSSLQNGGVLWLDCYNANPQSMLSAVESFCASQKAKQLLVLGELRELGDQSIQLHQNVGEKVADFAGDETILFTFGDHAFSISQGANAKGLKQTKHFSFDEIDQLATAISEKCAKEKCSLLIKGSRGAKLERLIPLLKNLGTL